MKQSLNKELGVNRTTADLHNNPSALERSRPSVPQPDVFSNTDIPQEDGQPPVPIQATGVAILPWAILTEGDLARAFNKHPITIRRAVERGELPEPVRLMGKPTWTGSVILKYLEGRLARAREETQIFQRHRSTNPKETL